MHCRVLCLVVLSSLQINLCRNVSLASQIPFKRPLKRKTLSSVVVTHDDGDKGRTQKKLRDYLGIFPKIGGGGLLNSQNFCKFTKSFLVCQYHSEVLKHVLQWGGGDI